VILILPLLACVVVTEKQLGYWRNSVTLFQHVVKVTPNNESAYIDLGQALYQKGQNADALAAYREALRLNPANYHVHFAAGDVLASMDKPAEALAEYNQCLSLAPDMPSVHTAAGRAFESQENFTNALAEFAKAEELSTNFAEPYLERAKIYFLQGLDTRAAGELHGAVRAQPDDFHTLAIVARYLAANANAAARDTQGALLLAVKANDLSGNQQPEVLDVLGMAFAANGNFTNAVDCAQNALENAQVSKLKDITPIQQRLALYQNHQPWRESFQSTNRPDR
jgi:tetratricopeptide (TPR) repeat protein